MLCTAAGLLALAWLAALAGPTSAAITISGDWTVSGVESYANDTITVLANGSTGNLFILPGGELHLSGILLILPNNRTLDNQGLLEARNSTIRSPNWLFYLRGAAALSDVSLFNVSRDAGGGVSGTYITNSSVSFERVRWEYTVTGGGARDWFIHIRAVMDFNTNYVGRRGQVSVELPTISSNVNIEIAYNRFQLGAGFGPGSERTTGIDIANALHSGQVTFDIHHNNFTDGDDGIAFGSSSSSTTYQIHDNVHRGAGSTALEVGQGAASDRFGGILRVANMTVFDSNRALRLYGLIGSGLNAVAENLTIRSAASVFPRTGVVANEAVWQIRNSTVAMASADTQYQSESNGHIRIYTTTDRTLAGVQVTQTGASVEHFAFLNVLGATWQNSVAILGQLVALREATGNVSLWLDPQNWAPREIVWWGFYFNAPQVDNRDLRPEVSDGGRTFPCAPSPFLVTDPMSPLSVVCTDNLPPTVAIAHPTVNWIQNWSSLAADGSASEYGSGLNTLEWSFDNASWGPVTQSGTGQLRWSVVVAGLGDGTYTIYARAVDRTGNAAYDSRGTFVVDTTAPGLSLPTLPVFASGTLLDLSGTTEGLATVTYRTAGGAAGAVGAAADGSFEFLQIPLVEGLNNITVTATDLAGNQVTRQATITVDTVPPSIAVFQEAVTYTKEPTAEFGGLSEAGAVVRVNSVLADRAGNGFSFTLALLPGLNPVTITSTDTAGNVASWFGAVWYDWDLPSLAVFATTPSTADDGTPVTRTSTVSINGNVGDLTTRVVSLTANGEAKTFDGSGAFFLSLPVSEGVNTFVFSATDVVGNVRSVTVRVLKDSVAPSAEAAMREADSPLVTIDTTVFTRGSFALVELSMSEDGVATVQTETRSVAAGSNLFNVSLHEGTNTISVSYRDRAGNLGTPKTLGIVRDTVAPTVVINSPADGSVVGWDVARVQVSGVSEAGARLTVNGELVAVNTGGGFTAAVDVLAGSNTTVTVVASDTLGNQNSSSVTVSRPGATVITTPSSDISGLLMLVVGMAAGVGAGFLIRGRSKGERAQFDDPEEAPHEARAAGLSAPAPPQATAPAQKGPKGPRGPQPPG